MIFLIVFLLAITCATCLVAIRTRQQSKLLLSQLDRQLDRSINGELIESHFNENYHSIIEEKLNRFLSASQKRASDELITKEHVQSLVSNIAHQTKTPLTNILLYSQLLEEQLESKHAPDFVKQIESQATKLAFFIDSLVKTSYLESELVQVHPRKNDLNLPITQSLNALSKLAEAKDITIEYHEQLAYGIFDEKWTVEALSNVIDNAIKYSPTNSQIKITVTPYEFFYCITVTDQGIGIAESEHAQIFERFYRSPDVSQHDGIGIGLYLTRAILTAQGGYITVFSEENKGTSFSLFFSRNEICQN